MIKRLTTLEELDQKIAVWKQSIETFKKTIRYYRRLLTQYEKIVNDDETELKELIKQAQQGKGKEG